MSTVIPQCYITHSACSLIAAGCTQVVMIPVFIKTRMCVYVSLLQNDSKQKSTEGTLKHCYFCSSLCSILMLHIRLLCANKNFLLIYLLIILYYCTFEPASVNNKNINVYVIFIKCYLYFLYFAGFYETIYSKFN